MISRTPPRSIHGSSIKCNKSSRFAAILKPLPSRRSNWRAALAGQVFDRAVRIPVAAACRGGACDTVGVGDCRHL